MTKLTTEQTKAVDKAVLTAIHDAPQLPRAADLLRVPAVGKAISARYLDNSLQRLRKRGSVEATRGGRWRVVHGRP
jgi:DNA-binding IscR family transcriptional regulator